MLFYTITLLNPVCATRRAKCSQTLSCDVIVCLLCDIVVKATKSVTTASFYVHLLPDFEKCEHHSPGFVEDVGKTSAKSY